MQVVESVKELAFSLSMAVEYLSQLTDRGLSADDAASGMRFSFGIGTGYFMEIAKLRAARILWSLITDSYNIGRIAGRMQIHSVTKVWKDTVTDPYFNMLRTQTEAMSAVLGGTDSLTVNPFDIVSGETGEFAERIARNQQLILREEAYFDKVTDPSSGSYYIENLTALVAENSWKLFLEIENNGGFLSALNSGFIKEKLGVSAAEKIKRQYMRPQFKYSDLSSGKLIKEDIHGLIPDAEPWITPEKIPVRNCYEKSDLEGMEHLGYAAGLPPFLGGPLFRHVRNPAMDNQAVRRFFNCRRVECFLQTKPGCRTKGIVSSFRPGNPSGIRL